MTRAKLWPRWLCRLQPSFSGQTTRGSLLLFIRSLNRLNSVEPQDRWKILGGVQANHDSEYMSRFSHCACSFRAECANIAVREATEEVIARGFLHCRHRWVWHIIRSRCWHLLGCFSILLWFPLRPRAAEWEKGEIERDRVSFSFSELCTSPFEE